MESQNRKGEEWINEVEKIYRDKGKEDEYLDEKEDITKIISQLDAHLNLRYQLIKPFDIGGTGILFLVKEVVYAEKLRALKFSRPLHGAHKTASLIKDEGDKLRNLSHPHIIEVYEVGILDYSDGKRVAYFVMDYIENAMDLKKKIIAEIKSEVKVKNLIQNLYNYLYGLILGLEYIHMNGFIHFDIKPENILIDVNGVPKVADLGYAKEKKGSGGDTTIGFTRAYAHPRPLRYGFKTKDEDRLKAEINRAEFRYEWDIYALGQSILELLKLVDKNYPDVAIHLPSFRYLHLMACRMLDGENTDVSRFFNEMASGLHREIFNEIKYKNMGEIRRDIKKEMGISPLPQLIPELDFLSRKILHGAETRSTTFTPRLKMLIEHPLFSRLSNISQLGTVRLLYPTANHTRFDHSIGTYTNACAYVVALYNDPDNPLFRQLINQEDIKVILLASLLHDLGQYPCAHDIEEVYHYIFSHTDFTLKLLENETILDSKNRNLKKIIEDKDFGFGVSIYNIKEVIQAKTPSIGVAQPSFKYRLLSTIIDGPIDADKVDYILRDSRECRLNYGKVIDFERLMKTITVTYHKRSKILGVQRDISLAVYNKGRACAESIAFSRYLLFSSVYWHHTSRACKTMLQHALRLMMDYQKKEQDKKQRGKKKQSVEERIKSDFLEFVISLHSKDSQLISRLRDRNCSSLLFRSDLDALGWSYQRSPDKGKNLLFDLAKRDLYKRLVSIHFNPNDRSAWEELLDFRKQYFSDRKYIELCDCLQRKLLIEIRRRKNSGEVLHFTTSLEDEKFSRFEELMSENYASILIDIPNPSKYVGSDTPLLFLKETLEKRYLDDLPEDFMTQTSELWNKHTEELMKSLAVIRIFCHPEVKNAIRATLSIPDILTITLETVRIFQSDR